MTRDEVQAVIAAMKKTADERRNHAMRENERSDRMAMRREADGLVEAARMLAEALEKSEAAPVECNVCNWVDCTCPKVAP
jgi:uncharacterized ferredoxin-like protein